MDVDREVRVAADRLQELVGMVFRRAGMDGDDAALLADALVAADLGGVHSHGVLRVPEYLAKLTTGGVDPRGRPRVVQDTGACLVVDGGNSMGQIGATFAIERAIERAATTGLAAVAIRGSNHCGALAPYLLRATARDMIGLFTTNALPTMAPWGGTERILGSIRSASAFPPGRNCRSSTTPRSAAPRMGRSASMLRKACRSRKGGRSTTTVARRPIRSPRSTGC